MSDSGARVVAADSVDADEYDHGQRTFSQYRLGHAGGGEELGTSLYELDPGNRTWPAHYHAGNEEAVFVLDGRLRLWLGNGEGRTEHALSSGDYVALPRGEAHAHEVEAAGDGTARFLVASTMHEPDFTVQPDADKVLLIAGDPPGEYEGRYLSKTLDFDAEVGYWDDGDGGSGNGAVAETDGGRDGDPVVSESDIDWATPGPDDRPFRRKQLGAAAGSEELGASLYALPPGGGAWLPHYHAGNEEAIYVLDGSGTVRLGPEREECALAPGDYVALPRGEAGFHDVRAGADGVRYLMVSTMNEPDVTVYPEDGKVGLYAGAAPGGDSAARSVSKYLDFDAEVDYWE